MTIREAGASLLEPALGSLELREFEDDRETRRRGAVLILAVTRCVVDVRVDVPDVFPLDMAVMIGCNGAVAAGAAALRADGEGSSSDTTMGSVGADVVVGNVTASATDVEPAGFGISTPRATSSTRSRTLFH